MGNSYNSYGNFQSCIIAMENFQSDLSGRKFEFLYGK